MVEITTITYCGDCGAFWSSTAAPGCTDPTHSHLQHERHRHRTAVTLPDGTTIVAVSFDDDDPYSRDEPTSYGVYLDERWAPPWRHVVVDWPDFGVPGDVPALREALDGALAAARAGARVEVGCLGGHGRTGTALACLAVLTSAPPQDAVAWVRAHYCDHAVETPEQAAFVRGFARTVDPEAGAG